MAIVSGQIGSLKSIKTSLKERGISRFDSIGDMIRFNENYELEKQRAILKTEKALISETEALKVVSSNYQKSLSDLTAKNKAQLDAKIQPIQRKCESLESRSHNNSVTQATNWVFIELLKILESGLVLFFGLLLTHRTRKIEKQLIETDERILENTLNTKTVIHNRSLPEIKALDHTKKVIKELNPLIAGALGENLVEKEIAKLSDEYILINDYTVHFDPPIYNKKENDRIFSIQIDHLLISKAGIFIIETKNWSKNTIENSDLRSPVKQIQRSSYALFVLLNGNRNKLGINLNWHHWGVKQFPIRNVVVMINEKPKEKFKFVQIKTLKELNKYITYFDPVFKDSEVNRMHKHLLSLQTP